MTDDIIHCMNVLKLEKNHYTLNEINEITTSLIEDAIARNDVEASTTLINARNYLRQNIDKLNRIAKMTEEDLAADKKRLGSATNGDTQRSTSGLDT